MKDEQHNIGLSRSNSVNAARHPYMRDDLWAKGRKGHFGWLWITYTNNPLVIAKLDGFVKQAINESKRGQAL